MLLSMESLPVSVLLDLSEVAHAADAPAATAPVVPFSVPPVPNFTANNISNLQGVLSECSGQGFAESLTALGACGAQSADYDPDLDLSCSFMSPAVVAAESVKIEQAINGLKCKKGQLSQARGKIDCLSKGASLMQAMIGQQRSQFEKEIQAAQSALRQLEQIKKGFEQQDETIGKRLKGDDESGAGGLLQAEKDMEGILAEMQGSTGTVEAFKKDNRALQDQKKFLLEQVQARTLEVTTDCIRNGGMEGKRYQCKQNDPDVNYLQYLGCLYEASFKIGEGGRIENDAVNKKRGEVNRVSFMNSLDRMIQSVPQSLGAPPSSAQQLDRFSASTELWFSFNDFKEGIRTRLSKFENKNFRIADRVIKKAESCFNSAKVQVSRERKGSGGSAQSGGQQPTGGSRLVDLQNKVKDFEESQNARAKKFFTDASKAYSGAIRPLIGRNVNLPIEACVNAKSSVQAGCMDQVVTNFEDLYLGRSELSKLNMVIPGNGAVKDLVVQCAGLKGCVTDLQAQHNHLQSTVKQVKQAKQKYAAEANQKIDAMRTSLAKAMAFPNQLVIQQQEDLNKFLAGLGVDGVVELEDVEGKEFEKDDSDEMDGLYKNPVGEDFLAAIGAGATPPLKKLGKDSFKDAYKGISEAGKEADEKIGKLNSLKGKLIGAAAKCAAEAAEKKLDKAQRRIDTAVSDLTSCLSQSGWCSDDQKSQLSRLISDVDSINDLEGAEGVVDSLERGMNICKRAGAEGTGETNGSNCHAIMDDTISRAQSAVSSLKSAGRSSSGASSAR